MSTTGNSTGLRSALIRQILILAGLIYKNANIGINNTMK